MKKPVILATRIFVVLVFTVLAGISIVLYRENTVMTALIAQQEFGSIPKDIARAIASDLDSGDSNKLAMWRAYLHHTLELDALQRSNRLDFSQLLAQYRALEKPGRSNYFGDLVNSLIVRQRLEGLTTATLIDCLGRPDDTVKVTGGEVLRYRFSNFGQNAVAIVCTSNSSVSSLNVTINSQ